jgi:hypothetical protein
MMLSLSICASASDSSSTAEEQVEEVIARYAQQQEDSFSPTAPQTFGFDEQAQLAQENGIGTSTAEDHGLIIQSAEVTPQIVSMTPTDDGYSVTANVQTDIHMVAGPGTTITLLGKQTDHLDSSATDRHVIQLKATGEEGSSAYTVVSDDIQESDEDGSQDSKPLSYPATALRPAPLAAAASDPMFTNSAGLNYMDEINYAEEWTDSSQGTGLAWDGNDVMNPDFPRFDPDNCTNFVSQALYAGGLNLVQGTLLDIADTSIWTWQLGAGKASRTWTAAAYNYEHMRNYTGAFDELPMNDPWSAWEGSLIYGDWHADGSIDHAMVVVGVASNPYDYSPVPVICQKSSNRHNYLFTDSVANANASYPDGVDWYTLQYRYD